MTTTATLLQTMLRSGERQRKLRQAFAQRGVVLVQLYRQGPYKLEALFTLGVAYWPIEVSVSREQPWTQQRLDDQLDHDLVEALDHWLERRPGVK